MHMQATLLYFVKFTDSSCMGSLELDILLNVFLLYSQFYLIHHSKGNQNFTYCGTHDVTCLLIDYNQLLWIK